MKQVLLIILLVFAVLAGYLFFFEPETVHQLMGKDAVITAAKDQPNPRIKKTGPKNQANTIIPASAKLALPDDGMRYYANGKSVSGTQVTLPAGDLVLVGYRDGSYRHQQIRLTPGKTTQVEGEVHTSKATTSWNTFQGGSLRTGQVDAGQRHRLDVRWQGHLGHKVQSSPIIYQGVAYFSSSLNLLNAIDLKDGKLLWATGNSGSSVTPIVNEQFGFAGDNLGAFTGFRLKDGKPKGIAQLDSYAVSLGRISELAFLAVTRSNTVFSIQTRKGVFGKLPLKVNWHVEVPELRGSKATPLITANRAIFQTEGHGLLAMNLADGSRSWPQVTNITSETFDLNAQSFVRDDIFLTPTPTADDRYVYGIQDEALVALTIANGDEHWRQSFKKRPCSSLAIAYNMLIFAVGDGTIRAHSAIDGQHIYTASVGTKPVFASPIIFGDKLLVATGEGMVKLLDVFSGVTLAEDDTLAGSGIDATPAVTENGILVINRRGDMVYYR